MFYAAVCGTSACVSVDTCEKKAERKRWTQSGWKFQSIFTGHDAMITLTNALTNILLELAKETCRSLSEN
jgi:hypothetical protein